MRKNIKLKLFICSCSWSRGFFSILFLFVILLCVYFLSIPLSFQVYFFLFYVFHLSFFFWLIKFRSWVNNLVPLFNEAVIIVHIIFSAFFITFLGLLPISIFFWLSSVSYHILVASVRNISFSRKCYDVHSLLELENILEKINTVKKSEKHIYCHSPVFATRKIMVLKFSRVFWTVPQTSRFSYTK